MAKLRFLFNFNLFYVWELVSSFNVSVTCKIMRREILLKWNNVNYKYRKAKYQKQYSKLMVYAADFILPEKLN